MASPPILLFAFANDKENSLRHLSKEAKELKKILQPAEKQGLIKVELLENAGIEDIYNAFNNAHGRVALFHYGGHSDSEFLSLEDGRSDARNLSALIGQEKSLRLVFLNGCANQGQVDKLFRNGVKGIVATEANIKDDTAIEFATMFYDALAKGKTVNNAFKTARSFLADKQLNTKIQENGVSWRSLAPSPAAEQERGGLALRSNIKGLPWGLYHNDDPTVLDWRLPNKTMKWQYWALLPLFFIFLFLGWFLLSRINPPPTGPSDASLPEVPLCPAFTDSADFKVVILPFEGSLESEREIADALNRKNREHRSRHPGRSLFYAEAAISAKKQPYVNEATLDSLGKECQANMVIWGYASTHAGQIFSVQLNVRSTKNVAIDENTRLPYDDTDGFTFLDSLEAQSTFIFLLIDGYFHCYDQKSVEAMEQSIAQEDWGDTTNTARLRIASQYYIRNDKTDEAIALLNRYEGLVYAAPPLIRNLGLCYVEKAEFKKASNTLNRMPESALATDLLQFRWRVHRRAGYFTRAILDIDRLLNMELGAEQKSVLQMEKGVMEKKLQQAKLVKTMEQQFQNKQWLNAINTADALLKLEPKHLRAIEVSIESCAQLVIGSKNAKMYYAKAQEYARRALQINPSHFRVHYLLMEMPARLGLWPKACEAAQKVLELNDKTYQAYEILIVGNLQLNNSTKACETLKSAKGKVSDQNYKKLAKICGGCCIVID